MPLPVTIDQLKHRAEKIGGWDLCSRIFYTRLGNGVIKDGDKYWLSQEVLTESITKAEDWVDKAKQEVVECEKYLDHYQKAREELSMRSPAPLTKP